MNELSLFTGAGGGLLAGILLGWRPVGYVEWDDYCQRVIATRIRDGYLPEAPIFGDIRAFNSEYAEAYQGLVDVLTAGFPCQPFSVAGKRLADADERNRWSETADAIRLVRPRYVLLENSPGLASSGYLGTVLADLAALGFDACWDVLSAAAIGAPHIRRRLWIAAAHRSADATSIGCGQGWQRRATALDQGWNAERQAGNADRARGIQSQRSIGEIRGWPGNAGCPPNSLSWWDRFPGISGMDYGMASRMDRIKCTGNGQVPGVAERAWQVLMARLQEA